MDALKGSFNWGWASSYEAAFDPTHGGEDLYKAN